MQIRSKIYPKTLSDACVTTFLFGIIPVIYYFELWVVLPRYYAPWGPSYLFHFCMGTFILFNLCSNLVAVILTDTSIQGKILPAEGGKNWRFCSVCETVAPPRSWHCPICKTCILKRDHHCMFTSCCIGHFNHRFFLVFVFYMFVATLYASIFNLLFIFHYVTFDSWVSIVKMVFPFATLFLEWTENQLYIVFIIIVAIGGVFTGVLFFYNVTLILKGMITHEKNTNKLSIYDRGTMENIKLTLGHKWYLVWLSPFIKSDLSCNGVEWGTRDSPKGK